MTPPHFLMTDPAAYEVRYEINPWMRPAAWSRDPFGGLRRAAAASEALREALVAQGARVTTIPAETGLPDLVFPANAAVVLDRKVLLARFRHPERQGEEAPFRAAFERLRQQGLVDEVRGLPAGVFQEGAGDAIWDAHRRLFWAGFGPRSDRAARNVLSAVFGQRVVSLELITPQFYHLDTCFCPLAGGDVLYYPAAFADDALAALRRLVAPEHRIEAEPAEAAAFSVNAVNLGRTVIMAEPPSSLRRRLEDRGYRVVGLDLSPFILSGGGAYCMTLRLDRASAPVPARNLVVEGAA